MTRLDVAILIACLGLGAFVAVPRHTQLATDTRRAEVEALARSAASAARLAHAQWQAQGDPATLAGARGVVAIVNGYPSPATLPLMLAEPETMPFGYDSGIWQHEQVPSHRPCGVSYTPPATADTAPEITARLGGC